METANVKQQKDTKSVVYIIDNLVHIIIIALIFYILWIPVVYYKNLLSWHAILGTLAYLFLMSESITSLSNHNWFSFITLTREKKIWTHGILFTTATIFAVLSLFLEYYQKERKHKQHFHTAHGITALIATILTVIAFVTGFSVTNCKFQDKVRPVVIKLIHNIIGQLAYSIGMLSLICAFYSKWMKSASYGMERVILVLLILFITSWVLINSVKNLYQQIKAVRE